MSLTDIAQGLISPVFAGSLWVIAAACVACLPMRRQYVPGLALLLAAPALVAWLAVAYGPWPALLGTLAVLSMFRRPLRYFAGRLLGRVPGFAAPVDQSTPAPESTADGKGAP